MRNRVDVKAVVSDLQMHSDVERRRAKATGYRHFQSRGTHICTAIDGAQSDPCPADQCLEFGGTSQEIEGLIELVMQKHPEVDSIYLERWFDGAVSSNAYRCGKYDPWVACVTVPVWTRTEGILFKRAHQ